MQVINKTVRVIKFTGQHIVRNFWQSLIAVVVIGFTFFIAQLFITIGLVSERVLVFFETQPQVTVFFKDEADEELILQIKEELEQDTGIDTVAYISKEQAVEIYRAQHQDDPELLEFVTPDILPASIEISVSDIDYLASVAEEFNDNQFVERVIFQQDLVEELMEWTNGIRKVGMVFLGIMVFIAGVIIFMVVANNIAKFGHEIEVMKLVGAGNWYVRLPFILDAVIFAVIAASIASGLIYLILPYMQQFINQFIAAVELYTDPVLLTYELWWQTLILGAVYTAMISFISVWRYLRV